MTNDEIVALAKAMREAGVSKFSVRDGQLSCELLAPAPTPMADLASRLGELPVAEREAVLTQAKKDLDADLYGAG